MTSNRRERPRESAANVLRMSTGKDELAAAVEDLYSAFAVYGPLTRVEVCTCASCMSPHEIEMLMRTPVQEIPSALIETHASAMGGECDSTMKILLPRYCDLLAQGEDSIGLGNNLCHLGDALRQQDPRDGALLEFAWAVGGSLRAANDRAGVGWFALRYVPISERNHIVDRLNEGW